MPRERNTTAIEHLNSSATLKNEARALAGPRARFELATLRLTVAALVFTTMCDVLLWR